MVTGQSPLQPGFFDIKLVLAVLADSHLVTISTKLFCVVTTGFKGDDLQSFCYRNKPRRLAAIFLTDQISFRYFSRGPPCDHFCQMIFNSDHLWQRRRF